MHSVDERTGAVLTRCYRQDKTANANGWRWATEDLPPWTVDPPGAPGTGKSATLRILADRLEDKRDVKVGIISRP